MQSKTLSFNEGFSFTIFKKNFTRFWPLWALYLIIWIFVMPVMINQEIAFFDSSTEYLKGNIYECAIYGGTVMSFIFCIFNAMAVYSYMYNAKSAGFMHALPIKRRGLFVSNYLSGLGFTVFSNIIIFLISLIVVSAHGLHLTGELLSWLAIVTMLNVFFFSFATFCANLTGHILMLPLIYGILSVAVAGVEFFSRVAFGALAYGFDGNASKIVLGWLSPPVELFGNSFVKGNYDEFGNLINYVFNGWKIVGIYCAAGIVLAVLALLIYRKRRTESAGDVVAVRPMKPVFKYCMAYGVAVTLGLAISYIFITPNVSFGWPLILIMLACMLFTGFIGYFAAEMLMKKSLKVFKKGLPGFLLFALVMVALAICIKYDVAKIERWIPDQDEIKSVSINVYGEGYGSGSVDDVQGVGAVVKLHEKLIEDKEELQQAYAKYCAADRLGDVSYYNIEIVYRLDGGKEVMRSYEVPVTEELLEQENSPAALLNEAVNSPSMIQARNISPKATSDILGGYIGAGRGEYYEEYFLDQQDAQKLYDALLADIEAGALGKMALIYNEQYYESALNAYIVIEYRYTADSTDETMSIAQCGYEINKNCLNTITVLENLNGLDDRALLTLFQQEYEAA